MRHGNATLRAPSDAERPLTVQGKEESDQIAGWLSQHESVPDYVLVSPYLRARETLERVRQTLKLSDQHEVMPELTPGGNAASVIDYLMVLASKGIHSLLIVSHLPLVDELVAGLCPQQVAAFSTASVACVDIDSSTGKGVLQWHMTPEKVNVR